MPKCRVCGSIFIGDVFDDVFCRVCKKRHPNIVIREENSKQDSKLIPIEIPDDLSIGVYITTMNHWNLTRSALLSFQEHTDYDCDVYILDGASSDNTPDKCREEFPWVHVLELDKPYWISYAWNAILDHALQQEYDYIAILNNDLIFRDEWFKNTIYCFMDDPNVGYATPIHYRRDGIVISMGKNRYGYYDETLYYNEYKESTIMPVMWYTGACFFLRMEAVRDIGYFDEKFFFGNDEVDYCLRLWLRGWKVVANPKARIVHLVSQTISEHGGHKGNRAAELKDNYGVTYTDPRQYFYEKWNLRDLEAIMETVKPHQDVIKTLTRRPKKIWSPVRL